jgi:hypothetical protein
MPVSIRSTRSNLAVITVGESGPWGGGYDGMVGVTSIWHLQHSKLFALMLGFRFMFSILEKDSSSRSQSHPGQHHPSPPIHPYVSHIIPARAAPASSMPGTPCRICCKSPNSPTCGCVTSYRLYVKTWVCSYISYRLSYMSTISDVYSLQLVYACCVPCSSI